jgi:hypothetical protein
MILKFTLVLKIMTFIDIYKLNMLLMDQEESIFAIYDEKEFDPFNTSEPSYTNDIWNHTPTWDEQYSEISTKPDAFQFGSHYDDFGTPVKFPIKFIDWSEKTSKKSANSDSKGPWKRAQKESKSSQKIIEEEEISLRITRKKTIFQKMSKPQPMNDSSPEIDKTWENSEVTPTPSHRELISQAEKETFDLIMGKSVKLVVPENPICEVCLDSNWEIDEDRDTGIDEIAICNLCHTSVHQAWYQRDIFREISSPWYCDRCNHIKKCLPKDMENKIMETKCVLWK